MIAYIQHDNSFDPPYNNELFVSFVNEFKINVSLRSLTEKFCQFSKASVRLRNFAQPYVRKDQV